MQIDFEDHISDAIVTLLDKNIHEENLGNCINDLAQLTAGINPDDRLHLSTISLLS